MKPSSRMDLFDGKDFAGWTFCMRSNAEPAATWGVTNGAIHCTGQPYGYARTLQSYRDYKLTVEWRFLRVAPHADNSGIFVHIQPPDKVFPKCIECQGLNQHQGDLILVGEVGVDGHPATPGFRILPAKAAPNEKPVGEWNRYEIVASGARVKAWVNGRLMNEVEGSEITSGPIGIQSEGGDIEIRKMYIEPVPSE